LQFCKFILA